MNQMIPFQLGKFLVIVGVLPSLSACL